MFHIRTQGIFEINKVFNQDLVCLWGGRQAMFDGAINFDQDISKWDVSSVSIMTVCPSHSTRLTECPQRNPSDGRPIRANAVVAAAGFV